jgi:glycosyltransferase involved in cell wall biosynthesis
VTASVDLIWLGQHTDPPVWSLGEVRRADATPRAVQGLITRDLPNSRADAWLFWASHLPPPDPAIIARCRGTSTDICHAGLTLGTAGLPALLDFVHPTWMLNCDPDPHIEASSWRISLDACLIRSAALCHLDGLAPGFATLNAAALELGHRALSQGLIVRHVPDLVAGGGMPPNLPFEDEARFVLMRSGGRWLRWALLRAVLSGYASPREVLSAIRISGIVPPQSASTPARTAEVPPAATVAVIIPTLGRNHYLRTVLDQLRAQTIAPAEVIIIDQNPPDHRDGALAHDYIDLPLTMLYQDMPGQSSARNAAIQQADAEFLLFLDDDDEIPPDLIAAHLAAVRDSGVDASCGRADEVGAGPLPPEGRVRQISSVFPANNTMIRRSALARSGLFDARYDRGMVEDADLGMRLYRSGALMIYEPAISVLHHHAPVGGLRTHRQRVTTFASSRQHLTHRSLPGVSELYYAQRYFTPRQRREMLWLRVFGTFIIRGSMLRKVAKALISLILLPDTLIRIAGRQRTAREWIRRGPQIPALDAASSPAPAPR